MLNRLCFKPSTSSTSFIVTESSPPNVTNTKYLPSDIVSIGHITIMFPFAINQLRCIPCHVFGAATVMIPHLLLGCYIELQNNLGFKSLYAIKLRSSGVNDAFRHLLNQPFRHIKLPNFTISNGVAFLHTIKTSDKG